MTTDQKIRELLESACRDMPPVPPVGVVIARARVPRLRRGLASAVAAALVAAVVLGVPSVLFDRSTPPGDLPPAVTPVPAATIEPGPIVTRSIAGTVFTLARHESGCLRVEVTPSGDGPSSSSALCGPTPRHAGNTAGVEALFADGRWFGVIYGSAEQGVTDVEVHLGSGDDLRTSTTDGLWLVVMATSSPWDVSGASSPVGSVVWIDGSGSVVHTERGLVGGVVAGATEPTMSFDVRVIAGEECLRVWTTMPDGTGSTHTTCDIDLSGGPSDGLARLVGMSTTVSDEGPVYLDIAFAVTERVEGVTLVTNRGRVLEMEVEHLEWERPLAVAWLAYDLAAGGGPPVSVSVTVAGETTGTPIPHDVCGATPELPGC